MNIDYYIRGIWDNPLKMRGKGVVNSAIWENRDEKYNGKIIDKN